jgi:hypothetical protein
VPLTEEDLADITMGDGNSDLSENLPCAWEWRNCHSLGGYFYTPHS